MVQKIKNEKIENHPFRNVSVMGVTAYAILCLEKYLLSTHPEKDYSPLLEFLWSFSRKDGYFDWWERLIYCMPNVLKSVGTYESYYNEYYDGDWAKPKLTCPTKEEFEQMRSLYDLKDRDLRKMCKLIAEFVGFLVYYQNGGLDKYDLEYIDDILSILENHSIDKPSIELVSKNSAECEDGWGRTFDFRELSLIYNQSKGSSL